MKIIAHRGTWKTTEEKNSKAAFERSIIQGFGIETDIRDYNGQLVIAHDVPQPGASFISFDAFLEMYKGNADPKAVLAINIKSDGLQPLLVDALQKNTPEDYFVFDMSMPDLLFGYRKTSIPYYASINEYLQSPPLFTECAGIWLDAFEDVWYHTDDIKAFLDKEKKVCIVSPELHGRDHIGLWQMIKEAGLSSIPRLSICTDLIEEADNFFND